MGENEDKNKDNEKHRTGGRRRIIYLWYLGAALAIATLYLLVSFENIPHRLCQPYPCHQCMMKGGAEGGEHLAAGSAANDDVVHWCREHFPGIGGNATYFCKDRHDVRIDASLVGLTAAQAEKCF